MVESDRRNGGREVSYCLQRLRPVTLTPRGRVWAVHVNDPRFRPVCHERNKKQRQFSVIREITPKQNAG